MIWQEFPLECNNYKGTDKYLSVLEQEARRQKPSCSMVLSRCYNEPWITAAGNSLLTYPSNPQKAYYAVRDSLRNVVPSAKMNKFRFEEGDTLTAEIWLLNDSCEQVCDTATVYLETDGEKQKLLSWDTGAVLPNENKHGHIVQAKIGVLKDERIRLILEAKCGINSYTLFLKKTNACNEA